MKALICTHFGPPEELVVGEIHCPQPMPGQVLIEVRGASLNFPDLLMVGGAYQARPLLPFVPGVELSGIVRKLGDSVSHLWQGQRVLAFSGIGAFAEQCVVDAERVLALPDSMGFDEGAAFLVSFATSLHALQNCGHLKANETLLVLGAAGGIGTAAIQLGKAMSATVLAAASSNDKLRLCTELGADAVIAYENDDLFEAVMTLTGGRGADVILDPVGGRHTELALRSLAWRGRLLAVGFASGMIPSISSDLVLLNERSVVGVYWGLSTRQSHEAGKRITEQLDALFSGGSIRSVVTERISLEQVPDAMRRMQDRSVRGKIVVHPCLPCESHLSHPPQYQGVGKS